MPLLGVPSGEDIAIVGTHFGQPQIPGWYFNLKARPEGQVVYRGKSVEVTAREADGDEWKEIWGRACAIYEGYEAYGRRIHDRKIPIMVLSESTAA
jgi:deazaflavin-dependent oxidoreductase (nitroreductase family)